MEGPLYKVIHHCAVPQLHRRVMRIAFAATLTAVICSIAACVDAPASPSQASKPVVVAAQRDWSDAILYFVLIDRFADGDSGNNAHVQRNNPAGWHGGDLVGLRAQLDEIAALGATAIWINPVVKQIDTPQWASSPAMPQGFEHWPFHGYWADDFERLDPHFGNEADLKALVEAAHARGMKVLLDVVYNHVGYGSHYLTQAQTHDWIRAPQIDCEVDALTCQVGGLPDLRTELPAVREYLLKAYVGLAQRTGLDGFRLDTVKHVEHDFWRVHRERTRAELGKDFFLLGEVWGGSSDTLDEWFAPDEMDAAFDFTFKGSCQAFVAGKGRTVAFAAYLANRHRVRANHYLVDYLSSHDEPMALYELGNDIAKLKLCIALQLTSIGIPMIYYGEEVGRRGGAWPDNRGDMPWGNRRVRPGNGVARNEDLHAGYQRLIALRRAHPALERGAFRALSTEGDLLVFAREDATTNDAVVVAINRGAQSAQATVPLPALWRRGAVHEALSGARVDARESGLTLNVPARTAQVYTAGTE